MNIDKELNTYFTAIRFGQYRNEAEVLAGGRAMISRILDEIMPEPDRHDAGCPARLGSDFLCDCEAIERNTKLNMINARRKELGI